MGSEIRDRPEGTADRILNVAERLVQVRGFNNVSYRDVADELGVTTASLHYHFPSKASLGEALIARYGERFFSALAEIDGQGNDAPAKLEAYAEIYAGVLRARRMCLCGILAAEYQTLPVPMQSAVVQFFDDNEAWLTVVVKQGQDEGTLSLHESPTEAAQTIIGTLEGAMLVARPYDDISRFYSAARRLLTSLRVSRLMRPEISRTGAE